MFAPGATILDALKAREIELDDFAKRISRSRQTIELLLIGDVEIDREMAIALSDVIGASPKFWLQRQADFAHDRHLVQGDAAEKLKEWMLSFPVADMVKLGWIPSTKSIQEKIKNCLEFFGVNSVDQWEARYSAELKAVAFRSSASLKADIPATIAWIRRGEIEATAAQCDLWDKEKFRSVLPVLRKLSRQKDPAIFIPMLKKIAASCGVAVVISRTPAGCRASGATKFVSAEKAMMMLSFRHRSDDHFWFTVFHEAAHLLLHDTSLLFIENGDEVMEKEEGEADQFAQDFLVSPEDRREFPQIRRDIKAVARFAQRIGVSQGVVLGQLQHLGYVDKKYMNRLKRRYDWDEIERATIL
ncbi:hypothetical protein ABI_09560 [Asticcacaulis biprosthecium C19]|uniref:IrrE N-terminal-like domain-containing protein n=1 Tax=Asticcacaulis biprosthecium C19 TaxID=715226 RepID=F4QGR7_9CAUL|nr:ImmA/IrrE family metallo-endopeptidase [Asticcacaulis biprosthecium]EGF92519.1 hypothetical protein ABI_09560 [Asticcacaulis biprosthecium C19]